MQMNCKFAIFMLVNICMSLFTTHVAGGYGDREEIFMVHDCERKDRVRKVEEYFQCKYLKSLSNHNKLSIKLKFINFDANSLRKTFTEKFSSKDLFFNSLHSEKFSPSNLFKKDAFNIKRFSFSFTFESAKVLKDA